MISLVVDIVRVEERLILSALRDSFTDVRVVDVRTMPIEIGAARGDTGIAVIRPISMLRALYSASLYEAAGATTVNSSETIIYSGDKVLSYTRLASYKLPLPKTIVALSRESALKAGARLGYPVVIKPPLGSWGRLVARARNETELATLVAHREEAGTPHQRVSVIQELVETGGRDIRCLVVGGEAVGCIERVARRGEWRSNVALGAATRPYPLSGELEDLAIRSAMAVKGFFVSIDLFETKEGLLVNEVNAVPEFKGFIRATGIDPARVLAAKLREAYKR